MKKKSSIAKGIFHWGGGVCFTRISCCSQKYLPGTHYQSGRHLYFDQPGA